MNSLTVGAAIAVCVAGWPLYSLVTAGSLDAGSALFRGGIVAACCALGVSFLVHLAHSYERQGAVARRQKLTSLFASMQDAVSDGVLADKGAAGKGKDAATARQPPPAPPGAPGA